MLQVGGSLSSTRWGHPERLSERGVQRVASQRIIQVDSLPQRSVGTAVVPPDFFFGTAVCTIRSIIGGEEKAAVGDQPEHCADDRVCIHSVYTYSGHV